MDSLFYKMYHKYRKLGFFSTLVFYILSFPISFSSSRFIFVGICASVFYVAWNIGCVISNCKDDESEISRYENPHW